MICRNPNCVADVAETAQFCPHCGTRMTAEAAPSDDRRAAARPSDYQAVRELNAAALMAYAAMKDKPTPARGGFGFIEFERKFKRATIENWRQRFAPGSRPDAPLPALELAGADFQGATLFHAQFAGANLAGADFREAKLIQCSLEGANLTGAHLQKSDWYASMLTEARLTDANLSDSVWKSTPFNKSDFTRACLRNARVNACCTGCCFHGADLAGAHLDISSDAGLDLTESDCSGAQIKLRHSGYNEGNVDFTGANLGGATLEFDGPRLPVFAGATLANCKMILPRALDLKGALTSEQFAGVTVTRKSADGDKRCFIATAACGTDQAEDVVRLREFRERVLRPSVWGRALIAAYERCSPPLAGLIGRSWMTRRLTRKGIVGPLSSLARRIMNRTKR